MKSPNRGRGERGLLNGGKGDKDRTTDNKSFSSNFDEIDFSGVVTNEGFSPTAHGSRKVYGPRAEKPGGPHICVKELRPKWYRIFAPHGWWARFTTNILFRPQWWKPFKPSCRGLRLPVGPSYRPLKRAEAEKALDKLAQEIYSRTRE